jgi:KDO2-lipid IV(A) lauroyltransferase
MRYEGTECLEAFHRAGRHVVVAGGHMNNWELYALTADRPVSHQVTAIYKRLADPVMDEAMRKTRERLGLKMVPTVEAQAWAAAHLQPEARPLQAVVFGFDQSPADPRKSWWTTFLHQETAWYFGLEKLACQYNLPVVYGQIKRTHRGHYVTRYEVLVAEPALCAEGDVLRACIDRLERDIRERPAEWLWTHKRWKHRRPEGAPLHVRERGTGVGTGVGVGTGTGVGTGVQRDEEDGRGG